MRQARRRGGAAGRTLLTAVAAVALLAATATGCTGGLLGDDPAPPVTGSVTFWDTSNETEAPFFNQLVAAFEKQYPEIDVTYVNVPFFEAQQRYLDAAAGGEAPDVLRADVGWTAGFVADGLLADLTGTVAEPDPQEFLDNTVAGLRLDGGVYGVPQVTDTLALLYNKALFEAAGLTRPPRDWDELRAWALTIKEETGADGIVLNTDAYYALPFLYGEDTDLVDPEKRTITVSGGPAVRGIIAAAGLVSSGAAPVPPAEDAYSAMQGAFKKGEAAMMINGPWSVADAQDGSAFRGADNLGIAPVPAGSTGTAGSPTGGHSLVVSADSRDRAAAELFTAYMTAAAQQEKAALALDLLPARKAAYTEDVLADPVRNAFYFAHTKSVARPPLAETAEMFGIFQEHYTAVLRGETTPEAGLDATARAWRDELLTGWIIPTTG